MPINHIKLSIKVQPNAGKNQIVGLTNEVWRIKIAAPPDKGKANKELIEFLSSVLGLEKNRLDIIKGHTSHNKIVAVDGLTRAEINARLSLKK
jgi:uncharacterized protein (TIGR00251 family)